MLKFNTFKNPLLSILDHHFYGKAETRLKPTYHYYHMCYLFSGIARQQRKRYLLKVTINQLP